MGKRSTPSKQFLMERSKCVVRAKDGYINVTATGRPFGKIFSQWSYKHRSICSYNQVGFSSYAAIKGLGDDRRIIEVDSGRARTTWCHHSLAKLFIVSFSPEFWEYIEKEIPRPMIGDFVCIDPFDSIKESVVNHEREVLTNKNDLPLLSPIMESFLNISVLRDGYILASEWEDRYDKSLLDFMKTSEFKAATNPRDWQFNGKFYPPVRNNIELCPAVGRIFAAFLDRDFGELISSCSIGQIYCLKSSNAIKVGFSVNPIDRVRCHQRWKNEIELVTMVKGTIYGEKEIHRLLHESGESLGAEWYPLSRSSEIVRVLIAYSKKPIRFRSINS